MASVNSVTIVGRVGQAPEVKTFDNGSMTKFSVATNEKFKKDGEMKEEVTWHNVVCFGKLGEICATYVGKGSLVYIDGKIQTRTYEKDGVKQYMTQIVANNVQFLSTKGAAFEGDKTVVVDGKAVKNHAPTFDATEEMPF